MGDRDYIAEADGIEAAVAKEHARWKGRLADAIEAGDIERRRPDRVSGASTYAALTPAGEELLRRAVKWQGGMRQRLGQADRLRHIQQQVEGGGMRTGRTSTIPDEGYADGGTPYTDEEMDIIDRDGGALEGLPTPPLARDMAAETGEPVQDCFGGWHGRPREGGPPGGRAKAGLRRLAGRIVAESEGAMREREQHELQQQYDAPAYDDPRRREREVADLEERFKGPPAEKEDGGGEWMYDEGDEDRETAAEAAYLNAVRAADAMLEEIPGVFEWSGRYPENASAIADFLRKATTLGGAKWLLRLADRMDAVEETMSGMSNEGGE